MTRQQFASKFPRVTRQTVDEYLAKHRPHLATHEANGNKGTYRQDAGPVASFSAQGGTWREVLMVFVVTEE